MGVHLLTAVAGENAPNTTTPIEVIVNWHGRRGPCDWVPKADGALPKAGDPCLVAVDERGNAWVICWEN